MAYSSTTKQSQLLLSQLRLGLRLWKGTSLSRVRKCGVWLALVIFSSTFSSCSSMLYYPTHVEHYPPSTFKLEPETIWTQVGDGQSVHGWYFHAKDRKVPKAILVFFHGNGQNLSSHYVTLIWLLSNGYDFFIFDYRGYGRSPGKPSPENTVQDGKAVVRAIYNRNPKLPLVIFGQSLGGAVAMRTVVDIKNEIPIKLVVIDSSFLSYRAAGRHVLSHHLLTWLFQPLADVFLSDSFAPNDRVREIAPIPMVIIHGDKDQVIDFSLGEDVFKAAGEPKEFWKIPGGRHTDALWRKDPNTQQRLLKKLDGLFNSH